MKVYIKKPVFFEGQRRRRGSTIEVGPDSKLLGGMIVLEADAPPPAPVEPAAPQPTTLSEMSKAMDDTRVAKAEGRSTVKQLTPKMTERKTAPIAKAEPKPKVEPKPKAKPAAKKWQAAKKDVTP